MTLAELESKLQNLKKAHAKKIDKLQTKREEISIKINNAQKDYQQESKDIKTKMQQILKDL